MDQPNDHGYCRARAELARDFAQRAMDPAISAAHAQAAAHYGSLAEQLERQRNGTDKNQAARSMRRRAQPIIRLSRKPADGR